MTKKELSQLYYLKKEIKEQQRRLKELEILATNCTANVTGLPNGTGVSDKIANYATEIADLKSLLDLNLKKCFYELNRLDRFIQSIDDAFIRQTVLYRFEKNMSWSQIARMLGGNNKPESIRKKLYRYLKKN
ncbi:MAG: hypothetical protein IJI84_04015 [Clostridia bacterium]|nr:hypothetical protein [Clostridia bacterium]